MFRPLNAGVSVKNRRAKELSRINFADDVG
jgi:hypothetical protein